MGVTNVETISHYIEPFSSSIFILFVTNIEFDNNIASKIGDVVKAQYSPDIQVLNNQPDMFILAL